MLLGSLSNEDDYESNENVAKRMRLHRFKLHRVYLGPLNLLIVRDFSWS